MKSSAYLYAAEGFYSQEIDTLAKIDRFGLEAITGRRQFYFGELRRLTIAENIVRFYQSRAASSNWAEWTNSHPAQANMLFEAEKLCQ